MLKYKFYIRYTYDLNEVHKRNSSLRQDKVLHQYSIFIIYFLKYRSTFILSIITNLKTFYCSFKIKKKKKLFNYICILVIYKIKVNEFIESIDLHYYLMITVLYDFLRIIYEIWKIQLNFLQMSNSLTNLGMKHIKNTSCMIFM